MLENKELVPCMLWDRKIELGGAGLPLNPSHPPSSHPHPTIALNKVIFPPFPPPGEKKLDFPNVQGNSPSQCKRTLAGISGCLFGVVLSELLRVVSLSLI